MDSREGFRFEATGTVEKLIAGAVPGISQALVSLRGEIWRTVLAQEELDIEA